MDFLFSLNASFHLYVAYQSQRPKNWRTPDLKRILLKQFHKTKDFIFKLAIFLHTLGTLILGNEYREDITYEDSTWSLLPIFGKAIYSQMQKAPSSQTRLRSHQTVSRDHISETDIDSFGVRKRRMAYSN